MQDDMRLPVFAEKKDRQLIYKPERCIGCGTCVQACPKGILAVGAVGAVVRGLLDANFLEMKEREECIACGICARVCPTGALELRQEGKTLNDRSYIFEAMKPTTVNERCVHCGLCEDICPQGCIEVTREISPDGKLKLVGKTDIDTECCVHCGWCAAVCPVNAIVVEKPFEGRWTGSEDTCQTCHTCVETCPTNAIFNKKAKPGEKVEKISHRPDACIYCGACAVSCPVNAIDVRKTAILPDVEKKSVLEKKLLEAPVPEALLRTRLETDEYACLGCGNCVIVCPVNALYSRELASGYLNDMDEKALLEVKNGIISVVNQDVCGADGACAMICPVNAIWLVKREVK
ncbi:TPA: 4Fe-4S binding protein [Methanosarcina acetivorans]|uniref:Formylmethanofuran dehydrogenase, subunit F n=2 Tax=Methanosarcina acetivorans TaxID=2214 RepID=Q8TIH5_METAC|nr:4Fe-4S binding protein [Methanosarcina acetivorans]AAM07522.1 formylmethanofuran dehydrogenase, subunit F [Methanosarcina acetivorans C2A]HIH95006.1 4Fe-4S binding protein [Methanosarcina acetivorans]